MEVPQRQKQDADEARFVWVCRQPGGNAARYRLDDLDGVHWDTVSGGRRQPLPQPFVCGYVDCEDAVEGEVGHSGSHGRCPHRIKVCVVGKDNLPAVMSDLRASAGPKPRPHSAPERAYDALVAAGPDGLTLAALTNIAALSKQYGKATVDRLERQGRIVKTTEPRPNAAGRRQQQVVLRAVGSLARSDDRGNANPSSAA